MGGSGTISLVTSLFGTQVSTRATLRRALCQELHMPFMRKTNGYSTVGASPTTTSIRDTNLIREAGEWTNQWWYNVTKDLCRKIKHCTKDTIWFDYPATVSTVGDTYEIHSIFNVFELHGAINRAIEDSFPAFFDYITDETTIVKSDTLKYDISGLTNVPWRVMKVWVEHSDTQVTGTATSGTTSTLIDTAGKFTNVEAGWLVSIHKGTGVGQLRTVAADPSGFSANRIVPTVVFGTAPDSTSEYVVWNPDSQTIQWEQVLSASFDAKEYPTYLYLTKDFSGSLGLRIRIEYMCRPLALTADASTTVVPTEFIINKALSILFGQKVNDNRADRNRYANLEEYRRQLAEQYRVARAYQQPDATIWQSGRTLLSRGSMENPF